MPISPHTALGPALAKRISDRAFRLYCYLVLRTDGEWTTIPAMAAACGLTHHQTRSPLAELRDAGLVEQDRRYETGSHGRKTWRTYVRLPFDATTGEAAA